MSDYELGGQPVTHPSWCVLELCTAPATYPTEYTAATAHMKHRSEALATDAVVFEGDEIYLSQSVAAPWRCETFLNIKVKDDRGGSRQMSVALTTNHPLLWAILAHAHDLNQEYPTLMEAAGWPVPDPGPASVTSSDDVRPADERRTAAAAAEAAEEGDAVDQTDGALLTVTEARATLAVWERRAEEAKAAGDQAAYAYRTARAEGLRRTIERAEDEDQPTSQPTAPARGHVQEEPAAEFVTGQAEAVIEGWTPGAAAAVHEARAALPGLAAAVVEGSTPRPNASDVLHWIHSGPCSFCTHGPACMSCEPKQGPVCGNCSEECKRREIAADPYYRGDYFAMFGDDE